VGFGVGIYQKYTVVLLGVYSSVVDWEFLARGVWAVRSIPSGTYGERTQWTAVIVAQGGTARIVLGERLDTRAKAKQLLQSISNHHFDKAFAVRKRGVKWYKLPNPTTGATSGYTTPRTRDSSSTRNWGAI